MGEDVAGPQHRDDVGIAWRRDADMGHQRKPDRVGRFEGELQGTEAEFAGHRPADPHLHADDAVPVGLDLGHAAIDREHVADRRLADRYALVEAEDSRERDVEKRQYPVWRMGHHIVAETVVVPRPGAAGIDEGGRCRASCDEARIDAERRRLVIDMGMNVDQAGRHDGAAHVLDPAGPGGEILAHRGDPAGLDGHVEHAVHAVALVQHSAALQDEIVVLRDCR